MSKKKKNKRGGRVSTNLAKAAREKERPRASRLWEENEIIAPCEKCRGGCRLADGTICPDCGGTGTVTKVTRAPDYMPGEDPFAGIPPILLRAWLTGVQGWWKGTSSLEPDGTLPAETSAVPLEDLMTAAGFNPDEKRVYRAQQDGLTRARVIAALNLSAARVGRLITSANRKMHALFAHFDQERRAAAELAADTEDQGDAA